MDKHRSDDLMPSLFLLQLSGLLTLQSLPGESLIPQVSGSVSVRLRKHLFHFPSFWNAQI